MDSKNQNTDSDPKAEKTSHHIGHELKLGEEIKPHAETNPQDGTVIKDHIMVTDSDQYESDISSLKEPSNDEQEDETPEKKHSIIKELLIWAAVTIAIVLIIQNFIFQAFYVSGNSMEPDYHNDDYLIISKIPLTTFDIGKFFGQKNININRGDVLVFRYPNAPETFFIKRAIGLPGERVTVKNGVVTIYNDKNPQGLVLKESYIDSQYVTQGDIDEVVEQGKVFVMGDNRSPGGSFDSREWGQLPQGNITGFAALRLLPVSTLKFITDPTYSEQ